MVVSVAWYIAMKTMASVNDGVKQGGKVVARVQKEETKYGQKVCWVG